jgi:diguanylate cyclase (GGDEF)-like protein/PAS domain S-box-containing protein
VTLADLLGRRDLFTWSISERYSAIIESSDDAIVGTTLDGTILSWNAGAERMYGFSADEALGQRLSLIVPADRAGEALRVLHAVGRGERVIHVETVRTRRDRTRFDVSLSVSGIRDASGRVVTALAIARDVSERYEADDALRASERRVRLLAEKARDLIFRLALLPKPRFEYVSPASLAITGFTPEELYDDPSLSFALIDPAQLDEIKSLLHVGRLSDPVDVAVRRKNGTIIWISQQLTLVRDDSGTLIAVEGIARDITDHKRAQEELAYAGLHDALTGLPNRLLLVERAEQARTRARVEERSIIAVALDLDDFTLINDTHGYEVADTVLVTVARRLSRVTRGHATISRTGSDEFFVIGDVATADDDVTAAFVELLRDALQQPIRSNGAELFVHACIGVAIDESDITSESLLRNAAIALSRAKQQRTRPGVEFFNADMRTRTNERFALVSDLHRALERHEFELRYQPIVRLADDRVVGAEALIRWQHPERGLMSPAEFIPLAEDTGLIVEIGAWVLDQACTELRRLSDSDPALAEIGMSVNVSVKQLRSPGIVSTVDGAIAQAGIDPGSLTIEMTESVFVDDLDVISDVLAQLRELGVRIAVDDFGTGYASLIYLKHLPLDTLKIDQTFVEGLGTDPCDAAIVASALSVSRALGLFAVAEGVETPEQLTVLRALGCDSAQGFYFSKPVSGTKLGDFVVARSAVRERA